MSDRNTMSDIWSHLILIFGLAAPIVTAINSTHPNTTHFSNSSTWDPRPTTSPNLTIIYGANNAAPTPGSFGILNGLPTQILNDTVKETTPVLADVAHPDTPGFQQPWNTSYPGPIHQDDWDKYLQIWDPVWWSTHLDSLRQISCHCSGEDFLTNPSAQLAAYMNFEYYSHQLGAISSFAWACGPVQSSMSISERITSGKHLSEHCWSAAGGEWPDFSHPKDAWFCDSTEELCVEPWRPGDRWLKFREHKRKYDRHGVHTWSETEPVVRDVCEPVCGDKFSMGFNDYSHHNPSFVTTFWPPKPIELDVVGD